MKKPSRQQVGAVAGAFAGAMLFGLIVEILSFFKSQDVLSLSEFSAILLRELTIVSLGMSIFLILKKWLKFK